MSESRLDQIVKGAPPPGTNAVAATAPAVEPIFKAPQIRTTNVSDPTSLLPSSPPQIYLNLLILEASLRSQYLTLRDRRRQNTFVLALLFLWITYFSYLLFLKPREDGQGVGGSVYWVVDRVEKMAWMGGMVTLLLFYATGQWERGVRWPRRWVAVANRGLRGMNCKAVLMKGPWWREMISHLAFLFPYQLFLSSSGSSYHYIEQQPTPHHRRNASTSAADGVPRNIVRSNGYDFIEEDIAPGGDYIKLLLLPKPFSADFREKWESYRTEYWEKENERRAGLRKVVKQQERETAKQEGGWLWWTGWRGWERTIRGGPDKPHLGHHHSNSLTQQNSLKDRKRRSSMIREHEGSHSRSSSRSSVYSGVPEYDERSTRPMLIEDRQRRWSNSTAGSVSGLTDRRRKRAPSTLGPDMARTTRSMRLTPADSSSRPSTPGGASDSTAGVNKRASMLSTASEGTESERWEDKPIKRSPSPAVPA